MARIPAMSKDLPSKTAMEMRRTLEEVFPNPFVSGSKYWHKHQRLLREAADRVMSIYHKNSKSIDDALTRGIIAKLEKDLAKIGPSQKQVDKEAAAA